MANKQNNNTGTAKAAKYKATVALATKATPKAPPTATVAAAPYALPPLPANAVQAGKAAQAKLGLPAVQVGSTVAVHGSGGTVPATAGAAPYATQRCCTWPSMQPGATVQVAQAGAPGWLTHAATSKKDNPIACWRSTSNPSTAWQLAVPHTVLAALQVVQQQGGHAGALVAVAQGPGGAALANWLAAVALAGPVALPGGAAGGGN